jgi:transposase
MSVTILDKVKDFKNKHYSRQSKVLLIWDNVSCHRSQEVKDWLKQNPNQIELDNFPPYSPEMNPIEKVWKRLKQNINHLRGEATLTEIMRKAREFLQNNTFYYKLFGLTRVRIFK